MIDLLSGIITSQNASISPSSSRNIPCRDSSCKPTKQTGEKEGEDTGEHRTEFRDIHTEEAFLKGVNESERTFQNTHVQRQSGQLVAIELGKFDSASDYYMESLKTLREAGDQLMVGTVLVNLGGLYVRLGQLGEARSRLQESLKMRQSLGDKYGMAAALFQLARVSLRERDPASASSCVQHALIMTRQVGALDKTAQLLRLLSSISAFEGERERAVWLFAAAENIRFKIGVPSPISDDEPLDLDSLRSAIGESRFQELSTEARIATLDEAINFALQKRRAA